MALFLLALTLKALGNEKLCSDAQGEVRTLMALAAPSHSPCSGMGHPWVIVKNWVVCLPSGQDFFSTASLGASVSLMVAESPRVEASRCLT